MSEQTFEGWAVFDSAGSVEAQTINNTKLGAVANFLESVGEYVLEMRVDQIYALFVRKGRHSVRPVTVTVKEKGAGDE
jgi:hypothetical protein